MSFEALPVGGNEEKNELPREPKETPQRLLYAVEMSIKPFIREVSVSGIENVEAIPSGKKVIIAATHLSDLDMALVVKALGKHFDIAVSDQSTHHSFREDPAGNMSIRLAGEKNFLPIDYKKVAGEKEAKFNPDNFASMAEALDGGKEVLVAAHNPSEDGMLSKGGVGAVYLAQLAEDSVILPVAVIIDSENAFLAGKNVLQKMAERPDAEVVIGSAISPEHIAGIQDFKAIMDKRKRKEKLSSDEIARFSELSDALKEQSASIMKTLAAMIPEEKRGYYAD